MWPSILLIPPDEYLIIGIEKHHHDRGTQPAQVVDGDPDVIDGIPISQVQDKPEILLALRDLFVTDQIRDEGGGKVVNDRIAQILKGFGARRFTGP
jgi:hypothetical protein